MLVSHPERPVLMGKLCLILGGRRFFFFSAPAWDEINPLTTFAGALQNCSQMSPAPPPLVPPHRFVEGRKRGGNVLKQGHAIPSWYTQTYSWSVFYFPLLSIHRKSEKEKNYSSHKPSPAPTRTDTHTLHPPIDYVLVIMTHTYRRKIKLSLRTEAETAVSEIQGAHTVAVVPTHTRHKHLQLVPQIAFY